MVGLYAKIEIDLDDRVGVVVLVNGPPPRWRGILHYAREALRAAGRGEGPPPRPEADDPTLVENGGDFAGTYTAASGATLVFETNGSHLLLRRGDEPVVLESTGTDSFFSPHPGLNRYAFSFGRDSDKTVVEVTHGPDWFTNESYGGLTEFETPLSWSAYTGRYRSYSPWFPYFEIMTRKGQLLAVIGTGSETGSGELVLEPRGNGVFHPGAKLTPEVLRFENIVEDEALRATWSGHEFFKVAP